MSNINVDGQQVPITPVNFSGNDRKDITRLKKSEQGKRASAVATAEIMSSFLTPGGASAQTQRNALAVLDELAPQLEEVTGHVSETEIILPASYTPEPEVEPEPVAAPSLDYELPDDIAALLGDDDDFEIAPSAVADEEDEQEFVLASDEEDDPQVAQLKAQLAKANKRTEHERKLRVNTARKDWAAEAKRVFNAGGVELVSDDELAQISADSRKGFLRAAKAKADTNKAVAERFAPRAAGGGEDERERIRAEERQRLEQMWGRPAGTGAAAPPVEATNQRLERARRTGNLQQILKARMFPDNE